MTRPPLPYSAKVHLRAADQALAEHHRNPASPAAMAVVIAQIEAATLTIRLARVTS